MTISLHGGIYTAELHTTRCFTKIPKSTKKSKKIFPEICISIWVSKMLILNPKKILEKRIDKKLFPKNIIFLATLI